MYGSEVIIVPIVFGMPTLLILAKMWIGYRERQASRQGLSPAVAETILARLEHLEHAVEAVAVEMERLGEGQRFTTRLLSERAVSAPPAPPAASEESARRTPGRVTTPH